MIGSRFRPRTRFTTGLACLAAATVPASALAAPTFFLPFQCGDGGWLASTFADHVPNVYAIDFNKGGDADNGRPVVASADGVVSVPAYSSSSNPLAIDHDGGGWASGWASLYLHMKSTVPNGSSVRRGDIVGYVSNVGAPGGNHLHYEQRLNRVVQPARFNNWTPDYGTAMRQGLGVGVPASDNCGGGASSYPNGTFVNDTSDGRVYVIAGGAPIYVSTWNAYGGPKPTIPISHAALLALRPYPADGTFVSSSSDGRVYVIAGGAPIYVSTWNAYGGSQPTTRVDTWAITNAGNPHAHLRPYPADGTFVSSSSDGRVYVIAGGAPIYVSTWNAYGGSQPTTRVDTWAITNAGNPHAHLRRRPTDATDVTTSAGNGYRIVGGAPIRVTSWSLLGAAKPVKIDQWAIDNAGRSAAAGLDAVPADGTRVRGLPSGVGWTFTGGLRSPLSNLAGAIAVDDAGLAAFKRVGESGSGTPLPSSAPSGTADNPSSTPTPTAPRPAVLRLRLRRGHGNSHAVRVELRRGGKLVTKPVKTRARTLRLTSASAGRHVLVISRSGRRLYRRNVVLRAGHVASISVRV